MIEWMSDTLARFGHAGVALLMLIENLIPAIPSELVMPFCGFVAAQGKLTLLGTIVAGVIGSMIGQMPWYFAGYYFGRRRCVEIAEKYGRWLTVSGREVEYVFDWFNRHGAKSVLIGRCIPGVRAVISVPAGINRMPMAKFLAWSLIGTTAWITFLTYCGFVLQEHYDKVQHWGDPVLKSLIALVVIVYLVRLALSFRHKSAD
ncbi:MAG: associated Golgi protein [Rhodospirillales bacterium]|nr:associated Golgi protein [Rhodospirillales bacterium]